MEEELPEEFINDFLLEIGEHSDVIEAELLDMEGGEKGDSVDSVFRAFHSIKGSASWMDFRKIVELCHHAEEILNDVRKRGAVMNRERVDLLFDALDILKVVRRDGAKDPEGIDPLLERFGLHRSRENIRKRSGIMKDDIAIWKRDEGDISVIMLEGDLGLKGTDKLVAEFVQFEDGGRCRMVLDLEKVSFICSSGLGGLAVTLKNLREKGGDLKLVNPAGDVKEKLEITELDKQFDICSSVKEAIGKF